MMSRHHQFFLIATLLALVASSAGCAAPALDASLGNLEGKWLFRTDPAELGEKEGWQKADFADGEWRELRVPGYWEAQGVTDARPGQAPKPKNGMPYSDYDGVAWYRLHFVVPKAWAGEPLELRLGSVDDQDRTYLNGSLIGETGPGVEQSVSIWRRYQVPADAVRWGEENVLAIRIFDGGGPGGIPGPLLTLLSAKVLGTMGKLPQADRPLAQRFTDPPAGSRLLRIIHPWPNDATAQESLIQTLMSQGFGGVVCNVSFDDYLESPARWEDFVRAVGQAKAAGMALWLYDERGYPSGLAGGLTTEGKLMPEWRSKQIPPPVSLHPDWEARGLLIAEATSKGGPVEVALPPGKLVLAAAYPVKDGKIALSQPLHLTGQVREGKLTWQAPAGPWRVLVMTEDRLYEGTHAQVSLADKLPYLNLLMPEPTARFLEVTHGRYAEHLGQDLGKTFVATFTDEPSLMSMFMRPMPYRVLPWAPNLAGEFQRRRGRALEPLLPALVAEAGPEGQKARYDYWQTVGELVAENFFGQIQEWCHQHNLRSGGHLLAEESILGHVPLYGDFFRCARRLDAPSIDCLTSLPPEVPWHVARLLGSVAELEGKTVTMCETSEFAQIYRPEGDERPPRQVTEEEVRGTCNRLMLGGINTITSYYSFTDLTREQLVRLNQWVGRCCTMLTGGDQVTDIAVLYPIESIWPRFTPARQGATDDDAARTVERAYRTASDSLYGAGRDFTYIDSRTLGEAKAADGALQYTKPGNAGSLSWRAVVLPETDTLPLAAWQNLAAFWRQGGIVIALGALPANSESEFPSPQVQALAREMFGDGTRAGVHANAAGGAGVYLPDGSEALLPLVLDRLLGKDVAVTGLASPIRVTHRRVDDREVYFLINDSTEPWQGEVNVAAAGAGEQWDPHTGKMSTLSGPTGVKLSLEPYGGTLLRFERAVLPKREQAVSGDLPGLTLWDLPAATPKHGCGEFVQGESGPDTTQDKPAWRMTGTLTKTKVDTFLFATFDYPQLADLSKADLLAIEAWMPEGQETPADLLVILREKDGGQYLASTGLSLGSPGHQEAQVPLSRFQAAGWAKDPNGKLDLDQIIGISIGWGGYFGQEGERVEFSIAAPRAGKVGQ